MNAPKLRPDGACPDCIGGWLCAYHQRQGLDNDRKRSQAIKSAVRSLRNQELQRIMARYELESDEFLSAEQKAVAIMESAGAA